MTKNEQILRTLKKGDTINVKATDDPKSLLAQFLRDEDYTVVTVFKDGERFRLQHVYGWKSTINIPTFANFADRVITKTS